MAESSEKGQDPNDEFLRKFGDPSKGQDHQHVDPTMIPKEPDAVPFKINGGGGQ